MLILFDIDMTLITTSGAGMRAMTDAAAEVFGRAFSIDGIEFAGSLDPLLIAALLERNGEPATPAAVAAVRGAYLPHLRRRLQTGAGRALPGVMDVLASLESRGTATGVLTGNFEESGRAKLEACGIDPGRFHVHVWGDDSPHTPPCRDHLPPVAMERFRARFGRDLHPGRVTIIGDTVHDIACAKAHGCRALGVTTGRTDAATLAKAGADRVAASLAEAGLIRWLVSEPED